MTQRHEITNSERRAAKEIFERYEVWLGDARHGNQDRWSCIETMAMIIHKHVHKQEVP